MYIGIHIHQDILVVKKIHVLMYNVDRVVALIIDSLIETIFFILNKINDIIII